MGALGQATNELGQLFVDIGLGGVGKTLKGLNSISASFLLVKTAAQQAMKPFIELGKTTIANSVKFGQMNATLGVSLEKVQQLSTYLEKYNIGEGVIGNLGSIMDMLNRVNMGLEGIDGKFVTAMTRIGLDWRKYRGGTFEDMLNLVNDVQEKVKGMDVGQARIFMQDIGLPLELLYAFQKDGFNLGEAFTIPNKSIENAQKFNEQLKLLKQNLGGRAQGIAGNVLGAPVSIMETSNKLMSPDENIRGEGVKEVIQGSVKHGPSLLLGPFGGAMFEGIKNINKLHGIDSSTPVPATKDGLSSVSGNYTISIQNDNKIYGQNAEEIAEKIAGITREDIISAENNAFQISNMAGA